MSALVIVQILNYVLPIITIPIIVRIIGPERFGIINYTSAIVGYFVLFIGFSFDLSATRLIAMNEDDDKEINLIFNRVFFAKTLLFLVSTVIFLFLLLKIDTFRSDRLIAIYTYLICVASIFDCNYFYTAKQDLKQTAFFNLVTKVLLNVSLLVFITKEADYIYQPLIISIAQIVVGCSAFFWAVRRYNLSIVVPEFTSLLKIIWRDKVLFFHSFAHTIYTTINIIMLGNLKGNIEVGYYTGAWKLIILIQALLISPLGLVLFPIIGQAFGKSRNSGLKIVQEILPVILFLTVLIGISILLFGGFVVKVFYGAGFTNSIFIFKLLSFVPMMLALNMLFGIQTMVNLKMDKMIFLITLSAAFLNVILNLILIHLWGSSGAAISWFFTEAFCTITMYIVIKKNNIRLVNKKYFNFDIIKKNIVPIVKKMMSKIRKPKQL